MNSPKKTPQAQGAKGAQQLRSPANTVALAPQQNAISFQRQPPTPPPVYRTQSLPKVLQAKARDRQVNRSSSPTAPQAYRPQPLPKVLQTKRVFENQSLLQMRNSSNGISTPKAPAVYRPQPTPRVLQAKLACLDKHQHVDKLPQHVN